MYANGQGGVEQDNKLAVQWYCAAAEQGDADACFNLGVMYANGRGVDAGLEHQGLRRSIHSVNSVMMNKQCAGFAKQLASQYLKRYQSKE
ncbi:MAG: tetratricopeptide repeat protein [Enterovibrio sp.]